MPPFQVFVASMKLRGKRAAPPEGYVAETINVTSAQAKNSVDRTTFSPMNGIPYTDPDEGTFQMGFESYWQSLKVIQGLSHSERKQYWKAIDKPKRRDPSMKIMQNGRVAGYKPVLHAKHKRFPNRELDYVESRKKVYVPDYYNLIRDTPRFLELKEMVQNGGDVNTAIVVYDFDGPKTPDGGVACELITVEMLRERINDVTHPFGHGFIVAAGLAGILPEEYV